MKKDVDDHVQYSQTEVKKDTGMVVWQSRLKGQEFLTVNTRKTLDLVT